MNNTVTTIDITKDNAPITIPAIDIPPPPLTFATMPSISPVKASSMLKNGVPKNKTDIIETTSDAIEMPGSFRFKAAG